MMVTIRGLPLKYKLQDVKDLLKNECSITEYILDNLIIDVGGVCKKVRVGLVEDSDGGEIIKCLNGLQMPGNYVLRVEAVGKPPSASQQNQNTHFDSKTIPSHSNEYRSNYNNQQGNDFRARARAPSFNASYVAPESQFSGSLPTLESSGGRGQVSSHTPASSVGGQTTWGPGQSTNNQWHQNQSLNSQINYQQPGNSGYTQQYSSSAQGPNTTSYPQGRSQQDQGFGFSPKANKREVARTRKADERSHVLRNVELVDTQPPIAPVQSGRYPTSQGFQQQPKPITIMKANFQGPTTYDIGSSDPPNAYRRQNQGSPQIWAPQGQPLKPQSYTKTNIGLYEKPYDEVRQHGPADKRTDLRKSINQPIRTEASGGYNHFEKLNSHYSPNREIASFSPSRRRPSQSRHIITARNASPATAVAPLNQRLSPLRRHMSPTRRLISPTGDRMPSIDRRPGGPPPELSQRRQLSPHERSGRGNISRYFPQRHRPDKSIDNTMVDPKALKASKHTRSAYDVTKAPNQPMYSGGFRSNVDENVSFVRSTRQLEQDSPWQPDSEQMYGKMKKQDVNSDVSASRQNIYADKHSPRKSRSPIRRERSPLRDRFRRHSPTSASPRRSWAFEKRHSPDARDAPPPPNWPGIDSRDEGRFNTPSDKKEDNQKHLARWNTRAHTNTEDVKRRDDKLDIYVGLNKLCSDDFRRKTDSIRNEHFTKHPKYDARNEFENRGIYRQTTSEKSKPYYNKQGIEYCNPMEREKARRLGEPKKKQSPQPEEWKSGFKALDKDIEHIYKKTQEFKKKAEEMRKSDRRLTDYVEERSRSARIIEESENHSDPRDAPSRRMNNSPGSRMNASSQHFRSRSPRRRIDELHNRRMEVSPRGRINDSPNRHMDGSPRRRREDSPNRRMEGIPQRRKEGSPNRHMEGSPRRRREDSLNLRTDGSPRRCKEDSSRSRMEGSLRRRREDSPGSRMEGSLRRRREDSPRSRMEGSPHRLRQESPNRRMEGSPRRRREDSPRSRMEGALRRRREDSPGSRMERSPRRRIEGSPGHHVQESLPRRNNASPLLRIDSLSKRQKGGSPQRRLEPVSRPSLVNAEHGHRGDLNTRSSPPREIVWKTLDKPKAFFAGLPAHVKVKRDKAAEEIAKSIMTGKTIVEKLNNIGRARLMTELKKTISQRLTNLFDISETSFIELVIKFQSKVNDTEKDKIFEEIVQTLPGQFRKWITLDAEPSGVPQKLSNRPHEKKTREDDAVLYQSAQGGISIPDWKVNVDPLKLEASPTPSIPTQLHMAAGCAGYLSVPKLAPPQLVIPMLSTFAPLTTLTTQFEDNNVSFIEASNKCFESLEIIHDLFLCQDDFGLITETQAKLLKDFVISELVKVTQRSQDWAPDFTFKGLQSMRRYVISTKDQNSRDWLRNLDFSGFTFFNVLVYTNEELWYERAAIWLPNHSIYHKHEPFEILVLQNKSLEGANVGKWKMVKKIVTLNGIRLYVDIPPSSARALEKHKMLLSYELQKVNVYLRAVAIDKDSFDSGLNEKSITDQYALNNVTHKSALPSITDSSSVLKVVLSDNKNMTLQEARAIKSTIIRHIYKHLSSNGASKTDFVKYGFMSPNYFGIVPENSESKRWLMNKYLGTLKGCKLSVIEGDKDFMNYFKMCITVPKESNVTALAVLEKLKNSNRGVKGIDFKLWKPIKLRLCSNKTNVEFDVYVDLQTVESLIEINYKLDYLAESGKIYKIRVESELSENELLQSVKSMKNYLFDNCENTSMDLESGGDDNDVTSICE